MDELTRFCKTCNAEREILSVMKDAHRQVIRMSCGHSAIIDVINETARMHERWDDQVKRDGKTIVKGMGRSKLSGATKRVTRESLNFDWKTQTKHHKVEEQQDDGTWLVVHEHTEPFKTKNPK